MAAGCVLEPVAASGNLRLAVAGIVGATDEFAGAELAVGDGAGCGATGAVGGDQIAATKAALTVRLESKITGVEQDGAKLVLVIGGDAKESFDIVVLAVGFGLEEGGPNHVGYWNDADGLDGIADGAKVLISGFGDGALRAGRPRRDIVLKRVGCVPCRR